MDCWLVVVVAVAVASEDLGSNLMKKKQWHPSKIENSIKVKSYFEPNKYFLCKVTNTSRI